MSKIHRLVPAPPKPSDDEHEILTLAQFAKRRGISRQTAYKWKDQCLAGENGLPPNCLLQDHRQRWFVDYTVYRNSMVVVK